MMNIVFYVYDGDEGYEYVVYSNVYDNQYGTDLLFEYPVDFKEIY